MSREATPANPSVRFGLLLWLAGMIGVASLLWMPLPVSEATELPLPGWGVKLLTLLQPTLLLTLAVWAGVKLASRVNLGAPAFEAAATGGRIPTALRPQIGPGVAGGILGGALLIVMSFLTPDVLARLDALFDPPLATRMLYGGITEELLLRWGLMTFLLWALLFLRKIPKTALAWGAIIISALLFGVLHLPVAFTLAEEVTASLVVYIVGGNAVFGVVAGYLYWQYGLEAAMIAHVVAHLIAVFSL